MENPVVAIEPQYLTTSTATYYTVPTGGDAQWAWVDHFTVLNIHTTTDYTVTVYFVPEGGTAGLDNVVLNAVLLDHTDLRPDTCPELIGRLLKSGDTIQAKASANSAIQIACNVREVS